MIKLFSEQPHPTSPIREGCDFTEGLSVRRGNEGEVACKKKLNYFSQFGGSWHHLSSLPPSTIVPSVQKVGAGGENSGQSVAPHSHSCKNVANLFAFI